MPILLLSAYDQGSAEGETIRAEIDGFLIEPIFRADVLEQMKQYIQGGHQEYEEQQIWEAERLEGVRKLGGVRILVTNSNELSLGITFETLNSSGVGMDCAHNDKEALDTHLKSSQGYYQVMLMGIHMLETGGLQVTRKICNLGQPDTSTVPVITTIADVFKEDMHRYKDTGMSAHVGRPMGLDRLYGVVQKSMNKAYK